MEFVEPDDDSPLFRAPPPPDDRLWRHPSELAGPRGPNAVAGPRGPNAVAGLRGPNAVTGFAPGPPSGPPPPPAGRPRPTWVVVGLSALVASLVTSGMVAVVLAGRTGSDATNAAIERQLVRPRSVSTAPTSPVVDIAERLRPAIVQLSVHAGDKTGTGSGVVFRSDGYLLTNAHVVDGATSIDVSMANGRQLPGRLVGTDAESDTAVVKLEGGPFSVATLGTGVDLRVGQPAVAIGFPLGLAGGPSVTGGMISALHRDIRPKGTSTTLVDMIQTDAPISPGSSGGALLDANGAVVGITTAVVAADAGEGLGFATVIDVAHSAAQDLISSGRVVHVWLGVDGGDLDGATATDLDVDGGAMVAQVKAESPAERAGLATRDVIVAVNGRAVRSMGELVVALRGHGPGDVVAIEVVRDRSRHTMAVTLVERPTTS